MQISGIGASSGYAVGKTVFLTRHDGVVGRRELDEHEVDNEILRFREAVGRAVGDLERLAERVGRGAGEEQAKIFASQVLLLQDPELTGSAESAIREQRINAEAALSDVTAMIVDLFRSMDDPYMRERAADVTDVSRRVMDLLTGREDPLARTFDEPVILVADDLTPSETARLDRSRIAGFAMELGGYTSHSAIIARSLGIPAVVGARGVLSALQLGETVIVDGKAGIIHLQPDEAMIGEYRAKREAHLNRMKTLKVYRDRPSVSADGRRVELAANIAGPDDAWNAKRAGAEGVGLYRTEFLYMGRTALPDEEEQFHAYKVVTDIFGPEAPVVIRTLDIGGDKELPLLDLPAETNPFLGNRAIRLCLRRPELFKTQLRAILRASHYGNIKLMYPMVATVRELREANRLLDEAKRELDERGIPYNGGIEVGIMIEVPSAALMADAFAREVDFFSIGTNDLVQYTMAADRMNEAVGYLTDPFQPAVIRLIRTVIQAAAREGRWVGMCGEMAGNPAAIPLLAGMGLYEFSMNAGAILPARALLARLRIAELGRLAEEAAGMDDASEIAAFLRREVPEIGECE
jgi:phosphotransferase system enzyme I (PtsI)